MNFSPATIRRVHDDHRSPDSRWPYTCDGENRLHSVATGGVTTTFVYDYMGRRISKTVGGTTTKFLWWDWKLAAELAANGSTVNRTYVWGPDFSDARGAAGGAGSLLAQIDSDGTISYAMPDARGNIVGYINTSGVIVAATEYNAYGAVVHSYGTVADHPFGFAGQYTDAESELVYYGLRYYIPKHGRFINRDPIEEAGGNNLFAFVGNGPTNGWDMLGLTTICYDEGVLGTICVTNDGHIPNGATLIGGGTVRLDGNGNLSGTTYTVDYSGNGATYQLYSHQDGRSDNFATIAAPSPNVVADYGRQAGEDYRNQAATNSAQIWRDVASRRITVFDLPLMDSKTAALYSAEMDAQQRMLSNIETNYQATRLAVDAALIVPGAVRLLGGKLLGLFAAESTTPLFRAVSPAELADLGATGAFRNPLGAEVKYFSTTAEGAASYARQTVGTGLYQGPYTIVRTEVPTNLVNSPLLRSTVDRGIPTIVVPTQTLPRLAPPVTLPATPLPPRLPTVRVGPGGGG